ncbi:g8779 [Coccomyxa viridis]|uniref:G8779 protein n=1 Tax=Coccomyxa viridis TaxID=1274662 RepID=A0ABP1G3V8_9CHLO
MECKTLSGWPLKSHGSTSTLNELQFVQQLEPRMKAGAGKLQELLSEGLAQAVEEGNASAHSFCLQAFAAIGDAAGAEKILREVVVATSKVAQRVFPAQVLNVLATAIYDEVGSLLHGIDHVQIGLQLSDSLGNAVLAGVDTQLATAMPGVFSVGVPERFVAD